MIKTKFVFAVSLVSLMVVNSAIAASVTDSAPVVDANKAPISGTVGTLGDVYDWSAFDGYETAGIAGVSYVNKAVDAAGNAAQWAENHAAAAGTAAVNAAESAADAAAAAATAAQAAANASGALAGKQDVLNGAQLAAVNSGITEGKVATYDAYAGQIAGKEDAANKANTADAATTLGKENAYPTVAFMEDYVSTSNTDLGIEIAAANTAAQQAMAKANAAVVANASITAGTATKITYDAKGLVTKGESLGADDIPTLPVSKISGLGSLATKSTVTSSEIADGAVTAAKTSGVIGKLPSGSETATALASIWVE